MSSLPASIFEKSRMLLMIVSSACPDVWIVCTNSRCSGSRSVSSRMHGGVTNPGLQQGIGRRDELAVHHGADECHAENDQHEEADEDRQERRRGARAHRISL